MKLFIIYKKDDEWVERDGLDPKQIQKELHQQKVSDQAKPENRTSSRGKFSYFPVHNKIIS